MRTPDAFSLPSASRSTSNPAFLMRKFTRTSSTTVRPVSVAIPRAIHFGKSSAGENLACAISCARITRSTCSSPIGTTICLLTTLVNGLPRTGAQVSTRHAPASLSLRPNISGSGLISVFIFSLSMFSWFMPLAYGDLITPPTLGEGCNGVI